MQRYDPPSNYFRVRLVCVLLTTCGQYFAKGSAAARLDRFLTYFQRYLLYKPPLPLDIEFDVQVPPPFPCRCPWTSSLLSNPPPPLSPPSAPVTSVIKFC